MNSPEVKNGWVIGDDDKNCTLYVNATCEVPEKVLLMLSKAFKLLLEQEQPVVTDATVFFTEGSISFKMDETGLGCVMHPIFYNVSVLQRQNCDARVMIGITEELVHLLLNIRDERLAKTKVVELLAGIVHGLRMDVEEPAYVLEADAQLWRFPPLT